jgi:glycine cleavage system aminomethyltransferase T
VAGVPVTAQSVSYVGEPGWELTTTADLGLRLWDLVWEAGRDVGLVAAGRRAFETLRLEAGYPAAGVDVTAEHAPGPAGLTRFTREAGEDDVASRVLVRLELDGIVSGGEPVRGRPPIGMSRGGRPRWARIRGDRDHPAGDVIAFDCRSRRA